MNQDFGNFLSSCDVGPTQLTYRNETKVCNACLWRLERSGRCSHCELRGTNGRQGLLCCWISTIIVDNADPTKAVHSGGVGRCRDGSACAPGSSYQPLLLLFCRKSKHKRRYLWLSLIVASSFPGCQSLSIYLMFVFCPLCHRFLFVSTPFGSLSFTPTIVTPLPLFAWTG